LRWEIYFKLGARKSSVAWEIYFKLVRARAPIARVDLDGIGYGPSGHFGSFEMKFQNVAAVWRRYADVGAHAFIVSGLRALLEDVEACTAAVPQSVPTVVCSRSARPSRTRATTGWTTP
jgi:hypothetical protein